LVVVVVAEVEFARLPPTLPRPCSWNGDVLRRDGPRTIVASSGTAGKK
jgi:hypothetical protein